MNKFKCTCYSVLSSLQPMSVLEINVFTRFLVLTLPSLVLIIGVFPLFLRTRLNPMW